MKFAKSIRLVMFTALIMGGLLGGSLMGGSMPVQAAAGDGSVRSISDSISIAPSQEDADQEDEFVNEGSTPEDAEASSGQSEYKYISVRRY